MPPITLAKTSASTSSPATARLAAASLLLCALTGAVHAQPIAVPNFSFESPDVVFAAPYNTDPAIPWQVTQSANQIGLFDNTAPDANDYIDNVTGAQVAFMFVGPGLTMFQDLSAPEAVFGIGNAYIFTIAAGGAASLPNDAQLSLRLYYRDPLNNDPATNKLTVAIMSYLFDPLLDPGFINHLYDYSVTTPVVLATDAHAGKAIGIEVATPGTAAFAYWDLDNARVESVPEPASLGLLALGLTGLGLRRFRARRGR